ncbi:MAG: polyphosphate polymerase domain-containing protein [Lachnospiraceae bacterium]|nr:polyphosphate polymerase domain-containing protein [Lachnospiraceae bacterium]
MSFQTVFKRYEIKYLITTEQRQKLVNEMSPYMQLDKYGHSTISNIYYDTDTYLLIRRSIEKPVYKEKLRIRSYGLDNPSNMVFVELKKKYNHTVYKRRIMLRKNEATAWLNDKVYNLDNTQISQEINYFIDYYKTLHPTVFLSYEREAFFSKNGSDFRITFDENILCRENNLSFEEKASGIPILPNNMILMEIKCSGGIPLWMTNLLSKEKIYKTSFSKYGEAYRTIIFPRLHKNNNTTFKEAPYNV